MILFPETLNHINKTNKMDNNGNDVFICKLTGYELAFTTNYDMLITTLVDIKCDYNHINAIVSLFKRAYRSFKNIGIKKIYMIVNKNELKHLVGSWETNEYDNERMSIGCDIDHFIDNWGKSSGFI